MSCERKRRFGSGRPGERRTLCSSPLLIPGNFEPAPNAEYLPRCARSGARRESAYIVQFWRGYIRAGMWTPHVSTRPALARLVGLDPGTLTNALARGAVSLS